MAVLATFFRIGSNLIVVPLVLIYLTPAEQALWWVFLALGSFANLADFGFGQVISRVYSFLWAGAEDFLTEGLCPSQQRMPNLRRLRQLNATVRFLYLRLAIVACIILGVAGTVFLIEPIHALPDALHAWTSWALFLATIGYNFATSHWLLASQGVDRVRQMQVAQLWSSIAYFVVVSVMLRARLGVESMIVAGAVRGLVLRHLARAAYYGAVPEIEGRPEQPDREVLKRLWPNVRKFGILAIGGYLLANGSVLVSSHLLGPAVTASFGLTNQIGNFIVSLGVLWLVVKWPQLTILRTQGRLTEMSVLFARRLCLVMLTCAVLAFIVVIFGNRLLQLKGTSTRLLPFAYSSVFFGYLIASTFYVQWGMLAMTDNTVPFFKVGLFTGLAMLALSVFLTRFWGLWGLILAPILAEFCCSAWYTIWRGFASQPLGWRQLCSAVLPHRVAPEPATTSLPAVSSQIHNEV